MDELSLPPTYMPPEAASPALDATFYYVLCTMSLVAAAFGNFILVRMTLTAITESLNVTIRSHLQIHQQPALGLIPQGTFLDRIYNHAIFGRHFQRFSDLFLIIVLSCVPLLLLPVILPSPSDEIGVDPVGGNHNWIKAYVGSGIHAFFNFMEVVQSYMTLQTTVFLAIAFWVLSVFVDFGNEEEFVV